MQIQPHVTKNTSNRRIWRKHQIFISNLEMRHILQVLQSNFDDVSPGERAPYGARISIIVRLPGRWAEMIPFCSASAGNHGASHVASISDNMDKFGFRKNFPNIGNAKNIARVFFHQHMRILRLIPKPGFDFGFDSRGYVFGCQSMTSVFAHSSQLPNGMSFKNVLNSRV